MIETSIQAEPFDFAAEVDGLADKGRSGALVTFTGHVRGEPGSRLELTHYPGMTEKMVANIAAEAEARFEVTGGKVIHRYGSLVPGEAIVLVAVTARHRGSAFQAAEFLIDWMKTKAPFWKREVSAEGKAQWVSARASDDEAAAGWS